MFHLLFGQEQGQRGPTNLVMEAVSWVAYYQD